MSLGLRQTIRNPLRPPCQSFDKVGKHSFLAHIRGRINHGLGIKSGILKMLNPPPPRQHLGAPSKYPPGTWVRVLSENQLRGTLDDCSHLRGLEFVPIQWKTCGRVYKVERHIRRMLDDAGEFRPITRTVLLEGVDCSGWSKEPTGCGRHCPLMYRDEWLELADCPQQVMSTLPNTTRYAQVKSVEEIVAGLDLWGRRDGLTFMPEMAKYAGNSFPVIDSLDSVFEYSKWIEPRAPIYFLAGLNCTGAIVGEQGPCERSCALLWHEDWLKIEQQG